MKHARKLASLLLALVMVFALATTAFAADNGTITVDNPIAGQTYTAYKIFDVVYDTNAEGAAGTHYSYTISGTSEWFSVVATKNDDNTVTSKITGLTFEKAYSEDTYVVIQGNGFSAPDFAKALKSAVTGKTGTTLTAQGNTVTASSLPLGYYFVNSTSGALANLTTTNPSVTIHDKNDMPFDKVDDKVSVDVGQTVNYTITGKVPDYTGFTTYTYLITDTMSEGLTFKKDVKVTVGSTNVTSACTITYNVDGNANKFTVSIPVKSYNIGAEIKVTYSAVVNENAVAKIGKNSATLTYSNDPADSTKTTTPADEETVYSSKIVIDKYETNNKNTKLAGAKFVLYKRGEGIATKPTSGDYDTVTNDSTATYYPREYYKYTAATETEGAKVDWDADKDHATSKITDDSGATSFNGLANGTYYLLETEAPAGYNLLTEPVTVTVNGGTTETALSVTAEVANNTGALLPSTGGMGTTIFYVLGSILAVGAIVLLVTKKRMSASDK